MTAIEDLLRAELRARAAAAESAAGNEPVALTAGELHRRIRRVRLRRRRTASALSAVAVAAAVIVPLALLSPGAPTAHGARAPARRHVPLTDTAVTPKGWAPVPFGDAQISVPPGWRLSSRPECGRAMAGYVVLGTGSTRVDVTNRRCRQPANVAAILTLRRASRRPPRLTRVINGIHVERVRSGLPGSMAYLAPSLHAEVIAAGPLAARVLDTLTWSPRAVALAPLRPFWVPRGWQWHEFGGVRFAAPAAWQVERDSQWGDCGFGIQGSTIRLSTAATFNAPICPAVLPTAGFGTRALGIVVAAGRFARDRQYTGSGRPTYCPRLHGLRGCVFEPGLLGNQVLTLAVFPRGLPGPVTVEIGLAGSGAIARAIFHTIGPARG